MVVVVVTMVYGCGCDGSDIRGGGGGDGWLRVCACESMPGLGGSVWVWVSGVRRGGGGGMGYTRQLDLAPPLACHRYL